MLEAQAAPTSTHRIGSRQRARRNSVCEGYLPVVTCVSTLIMLQDVVEGQLPE